MKIFVSFKNNGLGFITLLLLFKRIVSTSYVYSCVKIEDIPWSYDKYTNYGKRTEISYFYEYYPIPLYIM